MKESVTISKKEYHHLKNIEKAHMILHSELRSALKATLNGKIEKVA